jgi:hypothetical protein
LQCFFCISIHVRVQVLAGINLLQVVLNRLNTSGCAGKQVLVVLRY